MQNSRGIATRLAPALALGVFLLGGCTSIQVTSDYDPAADFSRLKSFAWAPVHEQGAPDARLDNDPLDKRVRKAIDKQLAEKGFQYVMGGEPDFWVTYHAGVENKVDVQTLYRSYPYRPGYVAWGGYSETIVRDFDQGTLIVDIVSPSSSKLIWRGTAQAEVHQNSSPEKRTKLVNDAVAKILSKFPPEQK
jgi:hypothetical protein